MGIGLEEGGLVERGDLLDGSGWKGLLYWDTKVLDGV